MFNATATYEYLSKNKADLCGAQCVYVTWMGGGAWA